ncbi:hypothetical protein AB1K32_07575 [Metabacillus dongyingensis]|uniref:hypothetical protein n=1 Tax=Metabacillus dongyingensis TaxID=2874282 RepID=UPI003B8AE1C4
MSLSEAANLAEQPNIDTSIIPIYIFVNVDENGFVIEGTGGTSPKPVDCDFFFVRDIQTLKNILKFRVVMNGFKSDLVLKEGETIQEIKTSEVVDEL